MRLSGRVWKQGRWWLVEVPLLDVMSQGRTKNDALAMIADAIESLVNLRSFKLVVYPGTHGHFELGSDDVGALIALLLRRQREMRGLTLGELARRLKQPSRNAYARYEQGKSIPTIQKLNELLVAVDGSRDFVLEESHLE